MYQSHTSRLTELWSLPRPAKGLNTNNNNNGKGETYTGLWWGKLREGDHLGNPGVGGNAILRWVFRKLEMRHGSDRAGCGEVAGTCECGNESSVSIKCGEFLD